MGFFEKNVCVVLRKKNEFASSLKVLKLLQNACQMTLVLKHVFSTLIERFKFLAKKLNNFKLGQNRKHDEDEA